MKMHTLETAEADIVYDVQGPLPTAGGRPPSPSRRRNAATASLFEDRVFAPDIARSHPGTPPKGLVNRLKDWFWNQLAYFL